MKSLKEIVHRLTFLQKINLSAEAYRECRAVNWTLKNQFVS